MGKSLLADGESRSVTLILWIFYADQLEERDRLIDDGFILGWRA